MAGPPGILRARGTPENEGVIIRRRRGGHKRQPNFAVRLSDAFQSRCFRRGSGFPPDVPIVGRFGRNGGGDDERPRPPAGPKSNETGAYCSTCVVTVPISLMLWPGCGAGHTGTPPIFAI